jgi:hypothetical protein
MGIAIDQEHLLTTTRKFTCEIDRRRRLPDAPLLVGHGKNIRFGRANRYHRYTVSRETLRAPLTPLHCSTRQHFARTVLL